MTSIDRLRALTVLAALLVCSPGPARAVDWLGFLRGQPTLALGMSEARVLEVAAENGLRLEMRDSQHQIDILIFEGGISDFRTKPESTGVLLYEGRSFVLASSWSGCDLLRPLRNHLAREYGPIPAVAPDLYAKFRGEEAVVVGCRRSGEQQLVTAMRLNASITKKVSAQIPLLLRMAQRRPPSLKVPDDYYERGLVGSESFAHLDELLLSLRMPFPYLEKVFDCSEMAAYLEWALESNGFEASICVKDRDDRGSGGHAWVATRDEANRQLALEPTAFIADMEDSARRAEKLRSFFREAVVPHGSAGYERYADSDACYDSIEDVPAQLVAEFDWWNNIGEWPPPPPIRSADRTGRRPKLTEKGRRLIIEALRSSTPPRRRPSIWRRALNTVVTIATVVVVLLVILVVLDRILGSSTRSRASGTPSPPGPRRRPPAPRSRDRGRRDGDVEPPHRPQGPADADRAYADVRRTLEIADVKDDLALIVHFTKRSWNTPLSSDRGRKEIGDFSSQLDLVFPVEFVFENDELGGRNHSCVAPIRVESEGGKKGAPLVLRPTHVMKHNDRCDIGTALEFIAMAKLVELGFPGFVFRGDRAMRRQYGLVASAIGEPFFKPGKLGAHPETGAMLTGPPVYPAVQAEKNDDVAERIHRAIRRFYAFLLLAGEGPMPKCFDAIPTYCYPLFATLFPSVAASADLIERVSLIALEKHVGLFRRHSDLAFCLVAEGNRITDYIEEHGHELLYASLRACNDADRVAKLSRILEGLPADLDRRSGFTDRQIIDIFSVMSDLYREERPSGGEGLAFGGEFEAWVGDVEIEKGFSLRFR